MHVCTVIHAFKQMRLDANFAKTKKALKTMNLDMDLTKMKYTKLHCSKKKVQGEKEKGIISHPDSKAIPPALAVAKSTQGRAAKAMEATKLASLWQKQRLLNCLEISSLTKTGSHWKNI